MKEKPANNPVQLNPFAFPTETDGRYFLLVMVIAGVTWQLGEWLLITFTKLEERVMTPLAFIPPVILFLWAWRRTKRAAHQEIESNQWQPFPITTPISSEQAVLDQLFLSAGEISSSVAEGNEPPTFVWDNDNRSVTGRAFGYGRKQYVLLRRGLFEAFVLKRDTFLAILLHELGHIANKDVSKTTFSIQLGRGFTLTAIIFLILHNFNAVERFVVRSLSGQSLAPFREFWPFFLETNFKLILLMIWIEVIRSSVLRVREYYADTRVSLWSGQKRALLQHILESEATQEPPIPQLNWRARFKKWFRKRIAPLHPTLENRIRIIKNPHNLFGAQWETALFAGMLCGLTLNGHSILMANLGDELNLHLGTLIPAFGGLPPLQAILGLILIQLGFLVVFLLPPILFGAYPIAKTVGVEIHKITIAYELLKATKSPLFPKQTLVKQAFLLSLGVLLGFIFSPFPGAFTLSAGIQGLGNYVLLPFLIFTWMIVFLSWIIPLKWFALQLYLGHRGATYPQTKRRWLVGISTFALFPPIFAMSFIQSFLRALLLGIEDVSLGFLMGGILIIASLGLAGYVFFWACGWVVLKSRKWLSGSRGKSSPPMWLQWPLPTPLPDITTVHLPVSLNPPPL